MKLYARWVRATQRLIDRLHPPQPGEATTPGAVSGWAFAIYMLISLALAHSVIGQDEGYTAATVGLLAAWAAGFSVPEGK